MRLMWASAMADDWPSVNGAENAAPSAAKAAMLGQKPALCRNGRMQNTTMPLAIAIDNARCFVHAPPAQIQNGAKMMADLARLRWHEARGHYDDAR